MEQGLAFTEHQPKGGLESAKGGFRVSGWMQIEVALDQLSGHDLQITSRRQEHVVQADEVVSHCPFLSLCKYASQSFVGIIPRRGVNVCGVVCTSFWRELGQLAGKGPQDYDSTDPVTGGTRGMRTVACRRCPTNASPPPSRYSISAWMERASPGGETTF